LLGLKLVRLIEKHSAEIAELLLRQLRTSEHTPAYRNIPEDDLRPSLVSLYAHLEQWLLHKSEADVERHFKTLGVKRAATGVPASQLAWALHMSKTQLWGFIYREGGAERALELYGELELLETLNRFFDRGICYALVGYEERGQSQKAA
jgi:hypothetical protein